MTMQLIYFHIEPLYERAGQIVSLVIQNMKQWWFIYGLELNSVCLFMIFLKDFTSL